MAKYRVEVAIGDISGVVIVEADSEKDAYGEAEEYVKNQPVEAMAVWPAED